MGCYHEITCEISEFFGVVGVSEEVFSDLRTHLENLSLHFMEFLRTHLADVTRRTNDYSKKYELFQFVLIRTGQRSELFELI